MPFHTRRGLEELLAAERQKTEARVRAELGTVVDEHIATVGRRNTELCARVAELETHNANLRAQLDARDARTTDTREQDPLDPEQLIAEVQALSKPRGQR